MSLLNGLWTRLAVTLGTLRREDGQTFTEYAIIVATITIGVVAAVGTLRDAVITGLTNAATQI